MQDFYWHLVENKDHISTCISKWHTNYEKLIVNIDEIWNRTFCLPFNIWRLTKNLSFQYKLIHSVIACNPWLKTLEYKTLQHVNIVMKVMIYNIFSVLFKNT